MKIPLKTKPAGAENVKGYVTQRLVSGGSLFLRASPYPTSHLELTKHGKTITRLAADNFNGFGELVLTTNPFCGFCSNRILLYFPMLVSQYVTGMTSQVFSII